MAADRVSLPARLPTELIFFGCAAAAVAAFDTGGEEERLMKLELA